VDGNSDEMFKKYWPANVHLIGKDILRFHTIYWPIMLMALDLPLPKQVFGHPWVLSNSDKMSKSKGNIVYADDLVKEFGVDAVRYYMLHEIPYSSDGIFTYELLIERINSDLANILGNLVNRTISMSKKYFDGVVTNPNVSEAIDDELKSLVLKTPALVEEKMNDLRIADAIDIIFDIFRRCNKYIDETMPWVLAKDEDKQDRLRTVLYNLLESIRSGAILLSAFLPDTANSIFEQLNVENAGIDSVGFDFIPDGTVLNDPTPLFARIDKNKKLEELLNK
jgi:methionyl-tRNA synthetase